MYELIQIAERSYYIKSPTNVGIVRLNENDVCLIDSGNNRDAGKRIKRILDDKGWNLKAIYSTHSNADHIGGNRFLQEKTGCKIYAPDINTAFTNHTILSPSFLYGGYPPKDLRHKFLLAQESYSQCLTEDALPEGFEIIKLPGHFYDMAGFRTPDNVIYLADCLLSRATLEKYRISFLYDVQSYIDTLEMVKNLEAVMFIPSHAEACEDISELAQYNIDVVMEIADRIMDICKEPVSFEMILKRLFDEYNLVMNFEQNVLTGSTVRSYLAWLRDKGRLDVVFDENVMKWKNILQKK